MHALIILPLTAIGRRLRVYGGDFYSDLLFGLRLARRNRLSTAVSIVILALGVAANVTAYTLVDAALLNPLPYSAADRIVGISLASRYRTDLKGGIDSATFEALASNSSSFESVAVYAVRPRRLAANGGVEVETNVASVSPSLFHLLGIRAEVGRLFTASDLQSAPASALVSYSHWLRAYNADRAIIGTQLKISSEAYTVIGVLPRGFRFPRDATDVWIPLKPEASGRVGGVLYPAIGRLLPGVAIEAARAEVEARASHLVRGNDFIVRVVRLRDDVNSSVRPALLRVQVAVFLILLVAVGSVSQLVAGRLDHRANEFRTRVALGATRGRLSRQGFAETASISVIGIVAGILLAVWQTRLFLALLPIKLWSEGPVQLHGGILLVSIGLSAAIVTAVGFLPIARSFRAVPIATGGIPSLSFSRPGRAHAAFMVLEIAVCCPLTVGAFLALRSFATLAFSDPGCDPKGVLTARIMPHTSAELLHALRSVPGIEAVGLASGLPLTPRSMKTVSIDPAQPERSVETDFAYVTRDFFTTLRMRIRAGRLPSDDEAAEREVIVNETFARRYWQSVNVVGHPLSDFRVAGVVQDVKDRGLQADVPPMVYYSHRRLPNALNYVVVRGLSSDLLRREVNRISGTSFNSEILALDARFSQSIALERFQAVLLSLLGAAGLALMALGVYGVVAHTVGRRTKEIALRMALGASRRALLIGVVRNYIMLALFGVALGLLSAFFLGRVLLSVLTRLDPLDVATATCVTGVIIVVTVLAAAVPALRATQAQPAVVLRAD